MEPLDLDDLACFLAVAEQLHFRRAARIVGLSPGALSQRVRHLEDALDVPVFQRSTRSVELTAAGRRLLPLATEAVAAARRCASVAAPAAPAPFALTVGTRFELGLSWLEPALDHLADARPERLLHLAFGDSPDLMRRLREGSIDAVVTSARVTTEGLAWGVLHDEHYVFCGSPALLDPAPLRGPEDAPSHTLIDLDPSLPLFRYLLDAQPGAVPWSFARQHHLGTVAAVRRRVVAGRGVAVLPAYLVRDDLRAERLVPLLPEVALRVDAFRLLWRRAHPLAHELAELADRLAERPLT